MKSFNEWCECWEVELDDEMSRLGLTAKERPSYMREQYNLYVDSYQENRG